MLTIILIRSSQTSIKEKKKKKKKSELGTVEGETEDRENAVKDLLNRSRRASEEEAQLAMQNTSTLRRRLSSAMTPDALKALSDPTSPAAVRENKKPAKTLPWRPGRRRGWGLSRSS